MTDRLYRLCVENGQGGWSVLATWRGELTGPALPRLARGLGINPGDYLRAELLLGAGLFFCKGHYRLDWLDE